MKRTKARSTLHWPNNQPICWRGLCYKIWTQSIQAISSCFLESSKSTSRSTSVPPPYPHFIDPPLTCCLSLRRCHQYVHLSLLRTRPGQPGPGQLTYNEAHRWILRIQSFGPIFGQCAKLIHCSFTYSAVSLSFINCKTFLDWYKSCISLILSIFGITPVIDAVCPI